MLPLTSVSFDQFITEEEVATGAQFPPPRFAARDRRFIELDDIYEGDYRFLVEDEELVSLPVTLGRRLVVVQSDLLLMSEPEAAYPLRQPASDAIRDMLAYGGACILAVNAEDGPEISVVSPASWYPFEQSRNLFDKLRGTSRSPGGGVFVRPFTSVEALTPDPDRVEVTIVQDGEVVESVHEWKGILGVQGEIGEQLDSTTVGSGNIFISPRSPQVGIWGQSIYLDLAAPLLELSKRFTQNSDILDKNAKPVPVWMMPVEDLTAQFPLEVEKTQAESIIDGLSALRQNDAIQLNQKGQKVDYLEFSGNIDASFEQVKEARELISLLSGLPAVLENLEGAPPSGVSLRLQYLPFYASTSSLQRDLTEVFSLALEELGLEPTITWPHIFEQLDGEAEAKQQQEMANMQAQMEGGDGDSNI